MHSIATLDGGSWERGRADIATRSKVQLLAVLIDKELTIAKHTLALFSQRKAASLHRTN
jgi:hypothetical protein